ncbi:hypothetical protein [Microbacterium sp. NPDC077184]|uniref:hypothetical protein n=1 Tax=Microbacterium sp. NPDC077184 TaxID=3154764 RepID=UPI00343215C9
MRRFAAVIAAASVAVVVSGCATGAGGVGDGRGAEGAETASADQIAASMGGLTIDPTLVYTTDVDGYDLAPQSVGGSAETGMSAVWFNATSSAMVELRTEAGDLDAESCAALPLWNGPSGDVTCTEEPGDIWYRQLDAAVEFIAVRDGALVRLIGNGASTDDLRAAAQNAHVPTVSELEVLFSDAPRMPTGEPVERGDLPENGDGAPDNSVGPGG